MKKLFRYILLSLAGVVIVAIFLQHIYVVEEKNLSPGVRASLPGEFIELENGVVHYELSGPKGGKPVVLVNGYPLTYSFWDKTVPALAASGYRVLRYDIYGLGYSDRPDAVYDRMLFRNQLHDLITKLTLDTGQIHLIGYSFGGFIAADFTLTHQHLVDKLILIAPFFHQRDIAPFDKNWTGRMCAKWIHLVVPKKTRENFLHPELYGNLIDDVREQMDYKGFRRAFVSTLQHTVDSERLTRFLELRNLDVPILLLWGRQDGKLPFPSNERLTRQLKLKFAVVEDAGHTPHYEQPGFVNQQILSFLNP